MKMMALAARNGKEIVRDRLNLAFGIGFSVILLLLLSAIQRNVPVELFSIGQLSPGVAVFGLSFISLFSAVLLAKDRSNSFMLRLYTSPLRARDFILAYTLPLLPIALSQIAVCFMVSFFLGLPVSFRVLAAIGVMIPAALLFIALGLLCGSLFNEKQVGGLCGALLTNLCGWLSGTWFDLKMVGGTFEKVAEIFPFVHAVRAARAAIAGDWQAIFPDFWWVMGYAAAFLAVSVFVFQQKINGDH